MIHFHVLQPSGGWRLSLEKEGHPNPALPLSMEVPLCFAERCLPEDVLLWWDDAADTVGLFRPDERLVWERGSIRLVQVVFLLPGTRPGVVGLEIGVNAAEEFPALAVDQYDPEAFEWLKGQRPALVRFFGTEVAVVDYGRDG